MRMLIAAGGTGGHLYPGLALASALSGSGDEAIFVGTRHGLEARVLPHEGWAFETIEIEGLMGRGVLAQARAAARLPGAVWASRRLIRRCRPDVVVGVGGYVSGPVVLAAVASRCRRILLEPNARPGLTNRWLAPVSDAVVTGFEAARPYFRMARVEAFGTPVRPEVVRLREAGRLGREPDRRPRTVLILGGSQGARTLNRAMVAAVPDLKDLDVTYIHQTGEPDWPGIQDTYRQMGVRARVEPFIKEMAAAYHAADLVVSRAGGTTLAELTVVGLPALLVPYPHATHNHQQHNARALVDAGAAEMLLDSQLTGPVLAGALRRLLGAPGRLAEMAAASCRLGRPDAAGRIVAYCRDLLATPGSVNRSLG